MSIDRSRPWFNPYGVRLALAADNRLAPVNSSSSDSTAESIDWSKHRRPQPDEFLLPISESLLDQLPPEVFPGALAAQYARIVNLIASEWNRAGTHPAFFDELLIDRRGGRRGFPAPVKRDLEKLRDYWYTASRPLTG